MSAELPRHSTIKSGGSGKSRKDQLDPTSRASILVYKYPLELEYTTQQKLYKELDEGPPRRCSKKPIRPWQSHLDISSLDMQHPTDVPTFIEKRCGDTGNGLAHISIPFRAWFMRGIMGKFRYLYIVSPDTSPESSTQGSNETSKEPSPTETMHATRSTTQAY